MNPASGQITGTPTAKGVSVIGLSATGPGGTGTATLTLQVNDLIPTVSLAPVFTSSPTATGFVGAAFNYYLSTTNNPTVYTATNLPAGLVLNASSNVLSGAPTAAGTFIVPLTAANCPQRGRCACHESGRSIECR